jgi:ribonuclease P protein component
MVADGARPLFRGRHRLTHAREFQAVYGARVAGRAGPIVVHARPNRSPCPRLGLSVGRRVGRAVTRNLVKRRLREAFRTLQHLLPTLDGRHYDLVIAVRPHEPLPTDEYRRLLADGAQACHRIWDKRRRRGDDLP